MASHIWSEDRLRASNIAQHIDMYVEDWNEPDGYTAHDSTISVFHACYVVTTPLMATFLGDGTNRYPDIHNEVIVVGTYIGDELISTTCIDPATAKIGYVAAEGVTVS